MFRPRIVRERFRTCVSIAVIAAGLLVMHVRALYAQANWDRPGADYSRSVLQSGDPAVCALQCERDKKCHAWSFNYPLINEDGAVCWLKSSVPARVQSNCCVSGVRGAGVVEPRNSAIEVETDRQGGDLRNVEVGAHATGETCKAVCEADDQCRAWTYARPGYIGRSARCFLKDKVTPPRRKPGFISGVVR